MSKSYADLPVLLEDLHKTLRKLIPLQQEKIQAVRAHDLDALNDCMKQEQAASLALRGLEQKRSALLEALGLTDVSLGQLAGHCPPEFQAAVREGAETLRRDGEELRAAQKAARTVVEKGLRRVNGELERRGVPTDPEDGAEPGAGMPANGMYTDFRA